MATLIPHLDPMDIKNDGERAVYTSAARLPADYTVLYSWHFPDRDTRMDETLSREADFIIVHPAYGYIVLEVKQGSVGFIDGQWMEYKEKDYMPMHDNPVEQAKRAMYAVLRLFKQETGLHDFPLHISDRYMRRRTLHPARCLRGWFPGTIPLVCLLSGRLRIGELMGSVLEAHFVPSTHQIT